MSQLSVLAFSRRLMLVGVFLMLWPAWSRAELWYHFRHDGKDVRYAEFDHRHPLYDHPWVAEGMVMPIEYLQEYPPDGAFDLAWYVQLETISHWDAARHERVYESIEMRFQLENWRLGEPNRRPDDFEGFEIELVDLPELSQLINSHPIVEYEILSLGNQTEASIQTGAIPIVDWDDDTLFVNLWGVHYGPFNHGFADYEARKSDALRISLILAQPISEPSCGVLGLVGLLAFAAARRKRTQYREQLRLR